MKAAVIEEYGTFAIRDVPEPKVGDYTALCELLYGATCTATDQHLIAGHPPYCQWVQRPFILGHESVGRVVRVGRKVRHFRPGDLVTRVGAPPSQGLNVGWGGFAEMGLATDHWAMAADGRAESEWYSSRVNQIVPAGIDPKTAPMFTTWRETMSTARRLGIGPGTAVLIAGSGGNGLSFAAVARLLGAVRVAMVGSARRESLARAGAGVQHYVDYRQPDPAAVLNEAVPAGFDFVIDSLGKAGMADRLLPCLRHGGRYLKYGFDDPAPLTFDASRARGAFTMVPVSYDEAETHQEITEAVIRGRLDAGLWYDLDHPYPLANLADAFAALPSSVAPKALIKLRGL